LFLIFNQNTNTIIPTR